MREVMILAFRFPPTGGGGVQRTTKFVKYLPEFGWRSSVVAPDWSKDASGRNRDNTLGKEIPEGTEIFLTGCPETYTDGPFIKVMRSLPGSGRLVSTMKRTVAFPDVFCRWIKQARPHVRRAIRARNPAVLYSTSPPFSAHSLALSMKKQFDIPWVADFRDPWSTNMLMSQGMPAWRRQINKAYERKICHRADVVIANTETNREALISQHELNSRKVVTITNGYDEGDFSHLQVRLPLDHFRISYVGSVYSYYTPATLISALTRLLRERPALPIKLTMAGTSCKWAAENIREPELEGRVELLGYIPHEEVPQLLISSHLLAQCLPEHASHWVPGKLYEYIRSGTPTLAICDKPSEIETLLHKTGAGECYQHNDTDGIHGFLKKQIADWQNGRLQRVDVNSPEIRRFDRRFLTKRLADTFDQAILNHSK